MSRQNKSKTGRGGGDDPAHRYINRCPSDPQKIKKPFLNLKPQACGCYLWSHENRNNDLNAHSKLALSKSKKTKKAKTHYVSPNARNRGSDSFPRLSELRPKIKRNTGKGLKVSTRGEIAIGAIVLIGMAAFSLIQWMSQMNDMRQDRTAPPGMYVVAKR
jgi:hypothetical protein